MGSMRISLPDDLHRNLKRRAIDESVSLKELVLKALDEYIKQHPPIQPTLFDHPSEKSAKE